MHYCRQHMLQINEETFNFFYIAVVTELFSIEIISAITRCDQLIHSCSLVLSLYFVGPWSFLGWAKGPRNIKENPD